MNHDSISYKKIYEIFKNNRKQSKTPSKTGVYKKKYDI